MLIYYFGYGSNMAARIMQEYCPDHRLIGAAQLADYQLAFNRKSTRWRAGVADVIPAPGSLVWGGLYAISPRDLAALDDKESNGKAYQRFDCVVTAKGQDYDAVTYGVIAKLPHNIPTSRAYRDTLLEGARALKLPPDYIEKIAAVPVEDEPGSLNVTRLS